MLLCHYQVPTTLDIRNAISILFIAGMTVFYIYHKLESDDWIKSTATIEHTNIEVRPNDKNPYTVTISYTFKANDLRYSGSSTSQEKFWKQDALRLEKQYPRGKSIAIIYDPDNPDRSEVKQPGWSGSFRL